MADPAWTSPAAAAAVAALASAIAAGLAVYNAWLLRHQGDEKLKIDLFERRYRIYSAVNRYIARAVQKGNITDEDLRELDTGCTSIEFLFESDVREYVTLVRNTGIDLMAANQTMQPLQVGEERSKLSSAICEWNKWFYQQFKASEDIFARYLKFPMPPNGRKLR